jgi:hypothetical protein
MSAVGRTEKNDARGVTEMVVQTYDYISNTIVVGGGSRNMCSRPNRLPAMKARAETDPFGFLNLLVTDNPSSASAQSS